MLYYQLVTSLGGSLELFLWFVSQMGFPHCCITVVGICKCAANLKHNLGCICFLFSASKMSKKTRIMTPYSTNHSSFFQRTLLLCLNNEKRVSFGTLCHMQCPLTRNISLPPSVGSLLKMNRSVSLFLCTIEV